MNYKVILSVLLFSCAHFSLNAMEKKDAPNPIILNFPLQSQYKKNATAHKVFDALARALFFVKSGTDISVQNSKIDSTYIDKNTIFKAVRGLNHTTSENSSVLDITEFIEAIQKPVIMHYKKLLQKQEQQNKQLSLLNQQSQNIQLTPSNNSETELIAKLQQQVKELQNKNSITQKVLQQNSYSRKSMATFGVLSLVAGIALPTLVYPSIKHLMALYFFQRG